MKKLPNIFWAFLVIIALLSEVYLLRQNSGLKEQLAKTERLKAQFTHAQSQTEQFLQSNKVEGHTFHLYQQNSVRNPLNDIWSKSKYVVLFYFDLNGCDTCVRDEIRTWNTFADKHDAQVVQVVGIADHDPAISTVRFKKALKIKFPVVSMDPSGAKLLEHGLLSSPAILFGETASEKCIYAFFPTPHEKSEDSFVQKLSRFLSNKKNKHNK